MDIRVLSWCLYFLPLFPDLPLRALVVDDDSGSIDFEAMRTGLQNLGYEPSIMLSSEDWDAFTHHGLFLDDDQQMKKETFELAMRFQLDEYSQVYAVPFLTRTFACWCLNILRRHKPAAASREQDAAVSTQRK